MNFTMDTSAWDKIKKQLLTLDQTELRVGWVDGGRYGPNNNNETYASVASLNEFGHVNGPSSLFPGAITPPRPFMRVGFKDYVSTRSTDNFKAIINSVISGQTALKAYGSLGPTFVKALQGVMDAWDTPPNARITQKLKGFNNPLVKTHELIDHVSFEVGKA